MAKRALSDATREVLRQAGRRGWESLRRSIEARGESVSEEMARRGSVGFSSYAKRYHKGNTERALFALQKGQRLQARFDFHPQINEDAIQVYYWCWCPDCDCRYRRPDRCPACGQDLDDPF